MSQFHYETCTMMIMTIKTKPTIMIVYNSQLTVLIMIMTWITMLMISTTKPKFIDEDDYNDDNQGDNAEDIMYRRHM